VRFCLCGSNTQLSGILLSVRDFIGIFLDLNIDQRRRNICVGSDDGHSFCRWSFRRSSLLWNVRGIVGALSIRGELVFIGRSAQHLLYNAGRISTYVFLGALLGGIGQMGIFLAGRKIAPFFYLFASLMLIALGLYLMGSSRVFAPFEAVGASVWKRMSHWPEDLFRHVQLHSLICWLGLGWLPCGLVYAALALALSSGSALKGAFLMLAFGLGTLPNLLLVGLVAEKFGVLTRHKGMRMGVALVVILLGVYGALHVLKKLVA